MRFTCLDDEGKDSTIKGIPRPIIVRHIQAMQLKTFAQKGCKMFAIQLTETEVECNKATLEDFAILRETWGAFSEDILSLPPKQNIDFTIDLVLGFALVSKDNTEGVYLN